MIVEMDAERLPRLDIRHCIFKLEMIYHYVYLISCSFKLKNVSLFCT